MWKTGELPTRRPGSLKLGISSKFRDPSGIEIKFIFLRKRKEPNIQQQIQILELSSLDSKHNRKKRYPCATLVLLLGQLKAHAD